MMRTEIVVVAFIALVAWGSPAPGSWMEPAQALPVCSVMTGNVNSAFCGTGCNTQLPKLEPTVEELAHTACTTVDDCNEAASWVVEAWLIAHDGDSVRVWATCGGETVAECTAEVDIPSGKKQSQDHDACEDSGDSTAGTPGCWKEPSRTGFTHEATCQDPATGLVLVAQPIVSEAFEQVWGS